MSRKYFRSPLQRNAFDISESFKSYALGREEEKLLNTLYIIKLPKYCSQNVDRTNWRLWNENDWKIMTKNNEKFKRYAVVSRTKQSGAQLQQESRRAALHNDDEE